MKLSRRSFPHPVLGNGDDVPVAAFQATLEMTGDKEAVYLDALVNCSSATINELIAGGRAEFVIHVECGNTLYRKAFVFSEPKTRIAIPADNLNDSVEANSFIRAARNISGYKIAGAHPDYGDAAFEIATGDILAVGEGQLFHIDSDFDALRRIGSIMQVTESPKDGDQPMTFDPNGDKIVIYLSRADFRDYRQLRSQEGVAGPLTTTIVLPVLIEALRQIYDDYEGSDPEEDGRRWVRSLHRKVTGLPHVQNRDWLIIAQHLLELPIKRALASSRQLVEGAS